MSNAEVTRPFLLFCSLPPFHAAGGLENTQSMIPSALSHATGGLETARREQAPEVRLDRLLSAFKGRNVRSTDSSLKLPFNLLWAKERIGNVWKEHISHKLAWLLPALPLVLCHAAFVLGLGTLRCVV